MKANTTDHPKFMKLQRRLSLDRWQAIGLLEAIWNMTAKNAPRGNIGKFSNEEIAAVIDWKQDEHEMIDALVQAGWIDECKQHRLVIHDWPDHCPYYVKGNVTKMGGFVEAKAPQQSLFADAKPEPKKQSSPKPQPDPIVMPPAIDTPGFRAKWDEWYSFRRENNWPKYKPSTAKRQLSKLADIGEPAAIQAIEHSMGNGYQGLFPEKFSGKSSPKRKPEPRQNAKDMEVGSW